MHHRMQLCAARRSELEASEAGAAGVPFRGGASWRRAKLERQGCLFGEPGWLAWMLASGGARCSSGAGAGELLCGGYRLVNSPHKLLVISGWNWLRELRLAAECAPVPQARLRKSCAAPKPGEPPARRLGDLPPASGPRGRAGVGRGRAPRPRRGCGPRALRRCGACEFGSCSPRRRARPRSRGRAGWSAGSAAHEAR